jgi:hypothetical protein
MNRIGKKGLFAFFIEKEEDHSMRNTNDTGGESTEKRDF